MQRYCCLQASSFRGRNIPARHQDTPQCARAALCTEITAGSAPAGSAPSPHRGRVPRTADPLGSAHCPGQQPRHQGSGEHLQGCQGGSGELSWRGAPVLRKWAAPMGAGPGAAPRLGQGQPACRQRRRPRPSAGHWGEGRRRSAPRIGRRVVADFVVRALIGRELEGWDPAAYARSAGCRGTAERAGIGIRIGAVPGLRGGQGWCGRAETVRGGSGAGGGAAGRVSGRVPDPGYGT